MKLAVFLLLVAMIGACGGEAKPATPTAIAVPSPVVQATAVPTPDVAAAVAAAVATAMAMNVPTPTAEPRPTVTPAPTPQPTVRPTPTPAPKPTQTKTEMIDAVSAAVVKIVGPREGSYGSGTIISSDGWVLTNHHVIEYAWDVKVYIQGRSSVIGEVVGFNESIDIALVKLPAGSYPSVEVLGTKQEPGEPVTVIGYPAADFLKGPPSVTTGVISETRFIEDTQFLQTDATLNPGVSGGAAVNDKGQLIGIPTAKLVREGVENIGFLVPTSNVAPRLSRLQNGSTTPNSPVETRCSFAFRDDHRYITGNNVYTVPFEIFSEWGMTWNTNANFIVMNVFYEGQNELATVVTGLNPTGSYESGEWIGGKPGTYNLTIDTTGNWEVKICPKRFMPGGAASPLPASTPTPVHSFDLTPTPTPAPTATPIPEPLPNSTICGKRLRSVGNIAESNGYLGIISGDVTKRDSIMNSSGDYGSSGTWSIFNPHGPYGNASGIYSAFNKYSDYPPYIWIEPDPDSGYYANQYGNRFVPQPGEPIPDDLIFVPGPDLLRLYVTVNSEFTLPKNLEGKVVRFGVIDPLDLKEWLTMNCLDS